MADRCCHNGYVVLSTERPPIYCDRCPLGRMAREMDADPLDDRKAQHWEQGCRIVRARLREPRSARTASTRADGS